jgi:hypothetical protein
MTYILRQISEVILQQPTEFCDLQSLWSTFYLQSEFEFILDFSEKMTFSDTRRHNCCHNFWYLTSKWCKNYEFWINSEWSNPSPPFQCWIPKFCSHNVAKALYFNIEEGGRGGTQWRVPLTSQSHILKYSKKAIPTKLCQLIMSQSVWIPKIFVFVAGWSVCLVWAFACI